MCNDYRYRQPLERLIDEFAQLRIPLRFPAGRPNIEPRDDIKITDRAAVITADGPQADLRVMRWSWPAPTGKPVYNFRSEGRRFGAGGRCLIPADGFYEFTTPDDPTRKRKDKWLFTLAGRDLFAIAGFWKPGVAAGEDAWTMLTCEPGPDIAPYHDRQVVVLAPDRWEDWLAGAPETELLRPSPAGTLQVEKLT